MNLPRVPSKQMIMDFIRMRYRFSEVPTERFISPAEISDDIFIQYGYRYYQSEVRNIIREMKVEPQTLPNKVKGYFLHQ